MRAKCDKWLVLIPFLCYPAIFIISAEIAVYGGKFDVFGPCEVVSADPLMLI